MSDRLADRESGSARDGLSGIQTALAGRYAVERELGRGGMATVYLARDLKYDRQVAVKVLLPDLAVALGPERFRREIELVSHFSHPHILPVYDSGEADGQLYYVMPFVRGESLRARLDRERQLPVDEALRITCEVAGALDYAHRQGIIHRDIKPENILLEDGQAILADFGIARAVSAVGEQKLTQTGIALGTPSYMSPEQAMAERDLDGRADVYSLGCVLYEMLAGMPPFTGPTAQIIIARHTLEDVPSLAIARGTIREDLEDAVLRALAKAPADRYRTAGDFADALRACQASGGVSLGRAERRGRPRRRGRARPRDRRPLVAAMAMLAMTAGGAVWAGLHFRGERLQARAAGSVGEGFDPRRIAVLYFDDRSKGQGLGYLADGLTEALIGQLDGIRGLDVISQNGVVPFRGGDIQPDSVGRLLKAGTLLEGSVDTLKGHVRVFVRLFDGYSGVDLKRKTLEVPVAAIMTARDTLAREVAAFLRERVGSEVELRAQRHSTSSAEAWSLLQRAERMRKDAEASLRAEDAAAASRLFAAADSVLVRAEGLDRRWAEPPVVRGAIAFRQGRLPSERRRVQTWTDAALEHANRALQLDPRSARALQLRGAVRYYRYQLRLDPNPTNLAALLGEAEKDLQTAVEIDPTLASGWNSLSVVQSMKSEFAESKVSALRAYEEDAYLAEAPSVVWRLYVTSLDLQQFRDADRWCAEGQRRFRDDSRFVRCQIWLMAANAAEGQANSADVAKAWRLVSEIAERTPAASRPQVERSARMWTAAVLARAGLADSARRVLVAARANETIDPEGELLWTEAFVRQLLGERDEALRLIKLYLTEHPDHRAGLAESRSWVWRDFHNDARFQALVGSGR